MEASRPEGQSTPGWTSVELRLADGTRIEVGRVPVASRVDLGTVEGLARLQVGARRRGWRVSLHHDDRGCPLARLLDLVGLTAEVEDVVAEAEALLSGRGRGPDR
jgi:hypothetical protein